MDDFRILMNKINVIYIGVMTILQPSSREFEVRPLRLQCRILSIEL
jgi:hypothetical protein